MRKGVRLEKSKDMKEDGGEDGRRIEREGWRKVVSTREDPTGCIPRSFYLARCKHPSM